MSPEQLQGRDADARSDIFSFGLVRYEMLTGRRAFEGSSPASVMGAILERPAPVIEPERVHRGVNGGIARRLAHLLQQPVEQPDSDVIYFRLGWESAARRTKS